MTTDGLIKGALAGAGAALFVMYIAKQKKKGSIGVSQDTVSSSALKDFSDEKLEELKDKIEDIIAEREAQ